MTVGRQLNRSQNLYLTVYLRVGVEDFKSTNKRLRNRMSREDFFSKLRILPHFIIYIKLP